MKMTMMKQLSFMTVAVLGGCLVEAQQPWDKYMLAPSVNRTFVAVSMSKNCGVPPPPPAPAACPNNTIGGTLQEWIVPGKSSPQLTLTCKAGQTMKAVDFASFGTPAGSCGSFQKSSCNDEQTTAYITSLCVGKSSCTIPVDPTIRKTLSPLDQLLGDPCVSTKKWLSVQLSGCEAAPPSPVVSESPQKPQMETLKGVGDFVVFDYGKEVGGVTTFSFGASDPGQILNVAYSESQYYSCTGDASQGGSGKDGFVVITNVKPNTEFVPDIAHMRGGFRYLIVILTTSGQVEVNPPTIKMVAAPNMPDPSAWQNHFYSSDDVLNRVWYGCGWTTQLCSINSSHGRQWPAPAQGWNNSANCGVGDVILVDGAKRDRVIWPGDMGVSVLTAFATTGDIQATKNALITLYNKQLPNGMLPYAGPPVNFFGNSDTYHLWALIGTYNTAVLGQQKSWLSTVWSGFQRGVSTCTQRISPTSGLFNVVNTADWARHGQGGENTGANALLYRVLVCGAEMATLLGDAGVASNYTDQAVALKTAINKNLFDESFGVFQDNTKSNALHPQDGNSLVAWFNATTVARQANISAYLKTNWNAFGSQSPEWNMDIGTFPGSMEVHAHFASGQADRAHDLIRLMWGYMLSKPESTQSTFWEGYHKDGSFAYRGNYMSNAHGWATGPAAAMTFNTLGIQATGQNTFIVSPNPGDLAWCEGSLSFADGQTVVVKWSVAVNTFTLEVDSSTVVGASGAVVINLSLDKPVVTIIANDVVVWMPEDTLTEHPGASLTAHNALSVSVTKTHASFSNVAPHSVFKVNYA